MGHSTGTAREPRGVVVEDSRGRAAGASRAEGRRRARTITGALVAVAVLVVAVVFVLGHEERSIAFEGDPGTLAIEDVPGPAAADADGGIPVGPGLVAGTRSDPDAVVVEVLFDYRCPYCLTFEQVNGPELERLADAGAITLVYRPVSFLDRAEGSRQFSTRAATAAAIVADRAPEHFVAFHTALLGAQPEPGVGPTDEDIAAVARAAGVPEAVVEQLTETLPGSGERTFARWVVAATTHGDALIGGLTTPTVLVDGERWPAADADQSVKYEPGRLAAVIAGRG